MAALGSSRQNGPKSVNEVDFVYEGGTGVNKIKNGGT